MHELYSSPRLIVPTTTPTTYILNTWRLMILLFSFFSHSIPDLPILDPWSWILDPQSPILDHLPWFSRKPPQTYMSCCRQNTLCILTCILRYTKSCHNSIRSWYFSWPTLKYTGHYTDLIHPATPLYLLYTYRYTDCVRPKKGSLYRPFHAVLLTYM